MYNEESELLFAAGEEELRRVYLSQNEENAFSYDILDTNENFIANKSVLAVPTFESRKKVKVEFSAPASESLQHYFPGKNSGRGRGGNYCMPFFRVFASFASHILHVYLSLLAVPSEGTPVNKYQAKCAGPYFLGPSFGFSPVRSIVQCIARKKDTDKYYTLKVYTHIHVENYSHQGETRKGERQWGLVTF